LKRGKYLRREDKMNISVSECEAIFAITGFLFVVWLIRRRKKP